TTAKRLRSSPLKNRCMDRTRKRSQRKRRKPSVTRKIGNEKVKASPRHPPEDPLKQKERTRKTGTRKTRARSRNQVRVRVVAQTSQRKRRKRKRRREARTIAMLHPPLRRTQSRAKKKAKATRKRRTNLRSTLARISPLQRKVHPMGDRALCLIM